MSCSSLRSVTSSSLSLSWRERAWAYSASAAGEVGTSLRRMFAALSRSDGCCDSECAQSNHSCAASKSPPLLARWPSARIIGSIFAFSGSDTVFSDGGSARICVTSSCMLANSPGRGGDLARSAIAVRASPSLRAATSICASVSCISSTRSYRCFASVHCPSFSRMLIDEISSGMPSLSAYATSNHECAMKWWLRPLASWPQASSRRCSQSTFDDARLWLRSRGRRHCDTSSIPSSS